MVRISSAVGIFILSVETWSIRNYLILFWLNFFTVQAVKFMSLSPPPLNVCYVIAKLWVTRIDYGNYNRAHEVKDWPFEIIPTIRSDQFMSSLNYGTSFNWYYWVTRASQVVLVAKNLPANAGDIRDAGSIPELGRSPGGRHGNPFRYSCLENPMDRGAWWVMVYRVPKSWT